MFELASKTRERVCMSSLRWWGRAFQADGPAWLNARPACVDGSAPFRLIPIRLTWTKLLLTDGLNASWRNAWRNPDPNPILTPTPTPTPTLTLGLGEMGLGEMGRLRIDSLTRQTYRWPVTTVSRTRRNLVSNSWCQISLTNFTKIRLAPFKKSQQA